MKKPVVGHWQLVIGASLVILVWSFKHFPPVEMHPHLASQPLATTLPPGVPCSFMPFEITTTRFFAAAHALRFPDKSVEPIHGHNWRVKVTVSAPRLDALGCVMDFHELERQVDAIIAPLHNRHLNELPPFDGELNPSTENVAYHVAVKLALAEPVMLVSVEVWETDTNSAVYRP
ncbi:MAG TPA: 6-carboxytetrahydropterin synthase [Tepidisphaeraceae bacterium]|jgi:6-pyruvoyltetrahydropterin/6-carboxytetrahydropterin synthase|nr:6-carboxytetrahydropterin synthase [Tepidisphaeraceae bacterium]